MTKPEFGIGFPDELEIVARETVATLDDLLPRAESLAGNPARSTLREAMRYAVLGDAKRIRAYLAIACADLFEVPRSYSLRVAAAIEIAHAYSLVHDDLPSMDDDALRRGQPTVHRKFGEAVAILVGDALQSLAFQLLTHTATHPKPTRRIALVAKLAEALGEPGMASGQMMDLFPDRGVPGVKETHLLKTGALFSACGSAGGILGGASDGEIEALESYGVFFGLAYQMRDDELDGDAPGAVTGTPRSWSDRAVESLERFGPAAGNLKSAARFASLRLT